MGPEWIIVGVIAVAVLFGAKKLPEMARSVGRAQGEFKKGIREGHVEDESTSPAVSPQPPQAAPPQVQPSPPQVQPSPPTPGEGTTAP
jgi:sec-independent protein translocase protein TatA